MITDPADDALRVATPILAFSTHPDFTTPQDVAVDDSGSVRCTTPINSGSSWIQERYRSLPSPSSHSQGEHRERVTPTHDLGLGDEGCEHHGSSPRRSPRVG